MSLSIASNWLWNFGFGYGAPYLVNKEAGRPRGEGVLHLKPDMLLLHHLLCVLENMGLSPSRSTSSIPQVAFIPPQAATHRPTTFASDKASQNLLYSGFTSDPPPLEPIAWNTDNTPTISEPSRNDDMPLFGDFADMDPAYIEHLAEIDVELLEKRKRTASDQPLLQFLEYRDTFVDEFIRLDGRREFHDRPSSYLCTRRRD
ncbi:hypothetical protein HGRIS_001456 [Hohenbuehelia grisea]|uniref:Uncharacterized protein n=1 Tax=Hohenbuehelia grisea TaxID=104357 RepID=A0ABR3JQF5_9AGAR